MKKSGKMKLMWKLSILGVAVTQTAGMVSPVFAASVYNDLTSIPPTWEQQSPVPKTNIIYIVVDDMGFSDFGCYGAEIKTPNIDKLAANGLRYNNSSVNPVCSPTRASLLTGRDSHAVGMGNLADFDMGEGTPDIRGRITDKAATVAQVLKDHGYATMAVGKWHAAPTHQIKPAGSFDYWPVAKGFEHFYGFLEGEADQYDPPLVQDNHIIETPKQKGYHFSEDTIDKAMGFISNQVSVSPDKPFFLYVALGAPHSPHQVPQKYIEQYKGVYDQGWDKIRQARFEKQKAIGIIPADAKLTAGDLKAQVWDKLSPEEKKVFARFEETYAGFLTHADEQIGRLVDYLKVVGQYDNTMIVLLSDNGATCYGGEVGSDYFSSIKGRLGGDSKADIKDYLKRINTMGSEEFQGLYPRGWAMVSNTPFKGYKGSTYHGGTRTPLIIQWPQGLKRKGQISGQSVDVSDITPTVFDVLGVTAPETYHGIKQIPVTGVSFANTFSSGIEKNRPPLYKLLQGNRSIVQNGWKAISSEMDGWSTANRKGRPFEQDTWELYNLDQDYTETQDLAAVYPEKLKQLQQLWQEEAKKNGAVLAAKFTPNDAWNNRNHYKFYPGTEKVSQGASPKIANKSYTITVPIERTSQQQQGVLVAFGDRFAGYTLYIKNNKLIFEHNYFGSVTKIQSKKSIPTGRLVVKYVFEKNTTGGGTGSLYFDDELVAMSPIERSFVKPSISEEGMSFGMDTNTPVSRNYGDKAGFAFNGKYAYVQLDLKS
ncbi:arylsulfatase [Anaerosinus massiliensis]|uniref:arylsulfatase n=1 Tax=Massilibacillus massiliensis TaxID=1806837 RepID=UPI000AC479EA|nr:arylsulfatase [Massilibacillus massiliensis]